MRKLLLFFGVLAIAGLSFLFFINREEKTESPLNDFYELTLKDPLFYSPFFDPQDFERSVEILKNSEDELKKVIVKNLGETNDFEKNYYTAILNENNLFPYKFLENLVSVNEETKKFLENPSTELGQRLLNAYGAAADSYIGDISSLIKILEEIEKHTGTERYLFFVDSISSPKAVKNDFLAILENGYKLKEEIEKRKNCLLGGETCQALFGGKFDGNDFWNSLGADFDLSGEKIDFIKSALPHNNGQTALKGPYKIKSFCWQNPDFEHWLYLMRFENEGRTLVLPKLANQNYYRGISPESETPINKSLLERGLKFYFQPEATTYECMDLTFYPQLLTLDFLNEQIKSGEVSKKDLKKDLNYKLLTENLFGLITPAIDAISKHLLTLKSYQIIDKKPIDPTYLFTVRTAYSIFYFPYAKSIWRIEKGLQYFVPQNEKPLAGESAFITLDELDDLGYSRKDIKKFHIGNLEELFNGLMKSRP